MLRYGGYVYGQPHSTTNYHRTHSGEHVTKVAERPSHAGGAVLQHHVVHKKTFKEADGGKKQAPARERCFDNVPLTEANYAMMAANRHAGGSHHRYGAYEEKETYDYQETYEETETYEYDETYEEVEEFVVGGDGCAQAQLRRGHRRA